MIRVLIAEDHEMVREGLQLFLAEAADIAVVGEAEDGEAALAHCRTLRPDVLLLDLVLPRLDGVAVTRQVRTEGTAGAVLILTSFAGDEQVGAALRAGAAGFLLKDLPRGQLIQAIRDVAAGRPALHPAAQEALLRQVAAPSWMPHQGLTGREKAVLYCLADGCSNKEIAARLGLTLGTVKGYVSAVLAKLGVADRTQAALYAHHHGLRPPD